MLARSFWWPVTGLAAVNSSGGQLEIWWLWWQTPGPALAGKHTLAGSDVAWKATWDMDTQAILDVDVESEERWWHGHCFLVDSEAEPIEMVTSCSYVFRSSVTEFIKTTESDLLTAVISVAAPCSADPAERVEE